MTDQLVAMPGFELGREAGRAEMLSLIETVQGVAPDLLPRLGPRPTLAGLAHGLALHGSADLAILKPFDVREAVSLKGACRIAGRSPSAVREWCVRYGIGRVVVGSLMVSRPALLALLDDDALAIAALLSGRRDHPAVRPYLARAGLPIAA